MKEKLEASGVGDKAGVFWADEMRVGLIGENRRVWAPRGLKVEQEREYVYEGGYATLAVNGLSGDLHWSWTKDMKAASIAPVVKNWAEKGVEAVVWDGAKGPVVKNWAEKGVEAVVWDGAKGHRGAAYEEVSVERIFQPPYSPELNPAERVFEFLRERIEGVVYGSLHNKKAAVEAELVKLAADPERIKSLTGWNWIHQAVAGLLVS